MTEEVLQLLAQRWLTLSESRSGMAKLSRHTGQASRTKLRQGSRITAWRD